jgi:hypothetical protein
MNLSATTGLCPQHDPARRAAIEQRRTLARTAEGKALPRVGRLPRGFPRALASAEQLAAAAEWAAFALVTGAVDSKTADVLGRLVKELGNIVTKRQLEDQVRALRQQLAEARAAMRGRST